MLLMLPPLIDTITRRYAMPLFLSLFRYADDFSPPRFSLVCDTPPMP